MGSRLTGLRRSTCQRGTLECLLLQHTCHLLLYELLGLSAARTLKPVAMSFGLSITCFPRTHFPELFFFGRLMTKTGVLADRFTLAPTPVRRSAQAFTLAPSHHAPHSEQHHVDSEQDQGSRAR